MNGLAEAGGYSKFRQHRCRIACHHQRSRWWRPGVYVAYPTQWLRTLTRPDYVTVTLINGAVVRYCQNEMEREVMDTASGGCHVRMPTHGASQGVMLGEQVTTTIAAPSVEMNDEMPPSVASDSECDDDEDESESSDGQSDSSSNTETIVAAQPLIAWCLLSDAFMRWMRYDGCETGDSVDDDDWDERSAAGSVQGLQLTLTAWREIPVNMVTLAGAFDNWKWCVRTEGLSEDEDPSDTDGDSDDDQDSDDAHSDTDGNAGDDQCSDDDGYSGDDQGSDDDGYSGDDQGSDDAADSGEADCKESIRDDGHQRMVFLEPLNSAGVLTPEIDEFALPPATSPKRPLDMRAFEAQLRRFEACEQYCMLRQWAFRTFRNTSHVETRLMIDTGLDLENMRESCMVRLLMRWRLFANRLHNSRLEE
jgi:hypothetical protein